MSGVKLEKLRKKVMTLAWTKKGRFVWNFISNLPPCLRQVSDSPWQSITMNVWKKSWSDQKRAQLWLKHFTIPNIIPDTFHCSVAASDLTCSSNEQAFHQWWCIFLWWLDLDLISCLAVSQELGFGLRCYNVLVVNFVKSNARNSSGMRGINPTT